MSLPYIHHRYLSSSKRGLDVCVSGDIKNFYTWNISNRENEHARCVAYVLGLIWSRFGFIYDHTRLIMYNIIVFLDFLPTVGENVAEFVWKSGYFENFASSNGCLPVTLCYFTSRFYLINLCHFDYVVPKVLEYLTLMSCKFPQTTVIKQKIILVNKLNPN